MPCAQYWNLSYHFDAQLSKLRLISCWQCSFRSESLVTPCGLIRYSREVMVASPF